MSTEIKEAPSHIKVVETDKYEMKFNLKTGVETLEGINGHDDPFALDNPSMLDIGVMGHCKNSCVMCYQGDKNEPNMKFKDYQKIIDEVKDVVNQVALGGRGDPNHHEDFAKIIAYSRINRVAPNYTTSGIDLTLGQVAISKMCGAVAVSDYQKSHTYRALELFMAAGIKTNIHTIFSKPNADRCIAMLKGEDVWDGAVDLDRLNAVVFLLFKPQGKGKDLDWSPDESYIKEFASLMKSGKTKFKIGMDSCMVNKLKQVGTEFSEQEEMMLDTCEGSRMSAYITADMRFLPCSFGDHDKEGISIKDSTIKEAWDKGHSFVNVRNFLTEKPNQCPYH